MDKLARLAKLKTELKNQLQKTLKKINISPILGIMLLVGYGFSFELYDKSNFYQLFLLIAFYILGIKVLYSASIELAKERIQSGLSLFLNLIFTLTQIALLYFVPKELNRYSDLSNIYLIFGIIAILWFIQDFLSRPKTYSFLILSKIVFYFALYIFLILSSSFLIENITITLRIYQITAFIALAFEAWSLLYTCQKYVKLK